MRCADCRYWKPDHDDRYLEGYGECLRIGDGTKQARTVEAIAYVDVEGAILVTNSYFGCVYFEEQE